MFITSCFLRELSIMRDIITYKTSLFFNFSNKFKISCRIECITPIIINNSILRNLSRRSLIKYYVICLPATFDRIIACYKMVPSTTGITWVTPSPESSKQLLSKPSANKLNNA